MGHFTYILLNAYLAKEEVKGTMTILKNKNYSSSLMDFFFLPQSDTQRKIERLNDLKIKINNENTSTTYSTQNIRTQIIK